ncbi:MAG: LysM peptidoglycan-binding domain-containing protein [Synergistaceae bacterium]|jgi:murein DD-endopeptidase MepM/ murein hydrolase activator NlpD|nr:LysM peptidoglycan-binding domain-containing protein [Synergistaceae bacterium]
MSIRGHRERVGHGEHEMQRGRKRHWRAGASLKKARWGFGLVVLLMVGLSAFFLLSGPLRPAKIPSAEGVSDAPLAWIEGFRALDLTSAQDDGAFNGAAFAAVIDSRSDDSPSLVGRAGVDAEKPGFIPPLPSPESFGSMPQRASEFEPVSESIVLMSGAEAEANEPADDSVVFEDVGPSWKEHVVKAGETLSDIAARYGGLTVQDIISANGLKNPNVLAERQILIIPNDPSHVEDALEEVRGRQARVAAARQKVVPLTTKTYTVKQGDSLWSIAGAENLELDTIIGSNSLKSSDTLQPGMKLRIPNQDGIFYTFKRGDTIGAVAQRYRVEVDRIKKVNPMLDLPSLVAGREIFLPDARPDAVTEPEREPAKKAAKASAAPKSSRFYRWPVMGRINSPFGWRRHPVTRRRDFHTGLDIKANRGVSIRSARGGKVVYAGWMGGYGKIVVLEHDNGQSTFYAHCSSLLVKPGTKVEAGKNIAKVGATGRATGPHLHFEVRNGNKPVNPLKYLK